MRRAFGAVQRFCGLAKKRDQEGYRHRCAAVTPPRAPVPPKGIGRARRTVLKTFRGFFARAKGV
jgi:hypothetical protein